jgi:hypothetical protein
MGAVDGQRECDVVMKGGITSGVVYPAALVELAQTYRFRGLGGASAGAIGAAAGAAAEFARDGFTRLAGLPGQLGEGRLGRLFVAQRRTRALMRLLNAYLGAASPGRPVSTARRALAVLLAATAAFPVATLVGLVPGLVCVAVGVVAGGAAGWLLAVVGVVVLVLGWLAALGFRLYRTVTVDLPANLFGICRGTGTGDEQGFTDWLAQSIDDVAGLEPDQRPLLFGDLWCGEAIRPAFSEVDGARTVHAGGAEPAPSTSERRVDLRMITTCLSLGRPFELPMRARAFFYDPATWRTLFPAYVVDALEELSEPVLDPDELVGSAQWTTLLAGRNDPPLRRLPEARLLPVIVATRLSLSFPVLISALPLWIVDFTDDRTRSAMEAFRAAESSQDAAYPEDGLVFRRVWFSDGGLCSNFPVHFFDGALTTRPTFAINLGPFPEGQEPSPDQSQNIAYAHDNRGGLLPPVAHLDESGLGAVTGFAGMAFDTARNWHDSAHLDFPGFRDRIVRVLQTDHEGGLNLDMDAATIDGLGARGRAAAHAMVDQFTRPHYPGDRPTGWDNHRWVRYRALLSCLPDWLDSWRRGRAVLDVPPDSPPGYALTVRGRELADELSQALDAAAAAAADADPRALADVTGRPNPPGVIRRVPTT